jgi:hypothetical protein
MVLFCIFKFIVVRVRLFAFASDFSFLSNFKLLDIELVFNMLEMLVVFVFSTSRRNNPLATPFWLTIILVIMLDFLFHFFVLEANILDEFFSECDDLFHIQSP